MTSVADILGRASLRSTSRQELDVPRTRLVSKESTFDVAALKAWNTLPVDIFVPVANTSTRQTHAFLVVVPSVWNGLLLAMRLLPRVHSDTFNASLKTVF